MAGIMNKISETIKGGKKEGGQNKPEQQFGGQQKTGQYQGGGEGQHKEGGGLQYGQQQQTGHCQGGGQGQRKEGGGIMDKVKDKIHGGRTGGTRD